MIPGVVAAGQAGVAFAEPFSGANGTAWDSARWNISDSNTTTTQQSGRGRQQLTAGVTGYGAEALAITDDGFAANQVIRGVLTLPAGSYESYALVQGRWVVGGGGDGTAYRLTFLHADDLVNLESRVFPADETILDQIAWELGGASVAFELALVGSTQRAKLWTPGTDEPTTPTLEAADGGISGTGQLRLRSVSGDAAVPASYWHEWDDITVAQF